MRGDIVETYKRLGGWMKKVSGLIFFFSSFTLANRNFSVKRRQ